MKRLIQNNIGLLIIPACLLATSAAFGQSGECREDADCAEGQTCEKGMFVGGCTVGPDEGDAADCNPEPQVAETGSCVTPPTPCDADADCGEYLSCVATSGGTDCAVDSEGNSSCPDPAPETVKYCSAAQLFCETDAECPRDFECASVNVCLAIACAEGDEECLDACQGSDQLECQPKQIACTETADCPSAWSCMGNYIETCSEGGSTGTDGGEEPVAPDENVTCTREPAVGTCSPDAWNGSVVYATDGGVGTEEDTTSEPLDNSGDKDGVVAGGGCSVARSPRGFDATWALGLLLALPLARRRRGLA